MDKTRKPSDLFAKLSASSAAALAVHFHWLGASSASSKGLPGRAGLCAAWASLTECARQSLEPALLRVLDLSCRQARSYVLDHARESRRDSWPAAGRVLEAVSTPDLAVRLYLDDPAALERAHFQYATGLLEQVAIYQGQYIADVIPSYDRRARMVQALQMTEPHAPGQQVKELAEFVSDDRFVIALHHGAQLRTGRHFDAALQLHPDLCQPEIDVAVLFRFDSSMLVVKARTPAQRAALRDAFVHIFVGDPHYFASPREHRPRYRLTLDAALLAPLSRPSLAKANARATPALSIKAAQV